MRSNRARDKGEIEQLRKRGPAILRKSETAFDEEFSGKHYRWRD
jgi:hypothetical protein